jgi:DNA-binding MarR family transcriptional regulator
MSTLTCSPMKGGVNMGLGLSELQKRILLYARDNKSGSRGGAVWFHHMILREKTKIGEAIRPSKQGLWTQSDVDFVSGALRRLETQGLISRNCGSKRCLTLEIVLTPSGVELVERIAAELLARAAT